MSKPSPASSVVSSPRVLPHRSTLATAASWGYFAILIVGFVVFRAGGGHVTIAGQEMSLPKALFTTINAGTLTGFQTTTMLDNLKAPGRITIFVLMLAGMLYSLIVGGTAATRILRLPFSDRQVGAFAVVLTTLATLLGGIALVRPDQPFLASFFQSASAFGNGGVWIGIPPTLGDWRTFLILLPLAILGGLGMPVLMELAFRRRPLSVHSRTTLALSAAVFLGGFFVLWAMIGPATLMYVDQVKEFIPRAAAAVINTRSGGLPLYYSSDFPVPSLRVLLILMLIGAGSAGTAGGLKLTALAILYRGTQRTLKGLAPGRMFGIVLCWIALLLTIIIVCQVRLLTHWPEMDADRLLLLSVSAATNTGLAHDRISPNINAYYVLSITMLLGRILPPMILWWAATTVKDDDLCPA